MRSLHLFSLRVSPLGWAFTLPLILGFLGHWASPPPQMGPELCANGMDDDGDGLIDLNDPDCTCAAAVPPSLIPNPSFEELDCCPNNRSELGCAKGWNQASEATTDLVHTCGWMGFPGYPPPQPFPDGEAVVGFWDGRAATPPQEEAVPQWKEYAGACLLGPLLAGTRYRIEFDLGFINPDFSPPINVTMFGAQSCDNLPFGVGNPDFGCPTNGPGWVPLGNIYVNGFGGDRWVHAAMEVMPQEDIVAIAIGPDCPQRPGPYSLYYFLDNLVLANFSAFPPVITTAGQPCADDFTLAIPPRGSATYQWYRNGIALLGETSAALTGRRSTGRYEVVVDNGQFCLRSAAYSFVRPELGSVARVTICEEDYFDFGRQQLDEGGAYIDTLRSVEGCDSVVNLLLTVERNVQSSVRAKIFPGEAFHVGRYAVQYAGRYELNTVSAAGCDSLVRLDLSYYQVYTPTAFSPNADGVNDVFTISGGPDLQEVVEISVYDRWGARLFQGTAWDGQINGQPAPAGVYVYTARIVMDDAVERQLSGSLALLR